jgi:hypothetical protein
MHVPATLHSGCTVLSVLDRILHSMDAIGSHAFAPLEALEASMCGHQWHASRASLLSLTIPTKHYALTLQASLHTSDHELCHHSHHTHTKGPMKKSHSPWSSVPLPSHRVHYTAPTRKPISHRVHYTAPTRKPITPQNQMDYSKRVMGWGRRKRVVRVVQNPGATPQRRSSLCKPAAPPRGAKFQSARHSLG